MRTLSRVLAIVLMTIGLVLAATPQASAATKPTIVLVHGAFADQTSWDGVAAQLRARGYRVVTPSNPLRGPAFDALRLQTALASISGPIVLVGHSYGGAVITQAHNPRVRALVYIAAFAPDAGEPVLTFLNPLRFPGSQLMPPALEFLVVDDLYGTGIAGHSLDGRVRPRDFRAVFAQDVSPATAATMIAHQKFAAASGNLEPVTAAAWHHLPSWYLISTNDHVIPPAAQRFMASRIHATTRTVPASHASLVSHPTPVAHLIDEASAAVKGQ